MQAFVGKLLLQLWFFLSNICSVAALTLETPHEYGEYCEADQFDPSCAVDEVIMITEAEYGRMGMGKCVKTDYGYVGCRADVIEHMASECSGRRTCTVRIPDKGLDEIQPCPKEFKTYLNATYKCVQVEDRSCKMCLKTTYAKLSLPRAYIASVTTSEDEYGCGTARCPWLIEVESGQKINITLFDFAVVSQPRKYFVSESCFRYANIKEKAAPRDTPVCGGRKPTSHVYTSVSNAIELHIVSPEVYNTRGQFLLYYEAVGCPDLSPPSNTWLKREDDRITVGCEATGDTWRLQCKGTAWEGEIGTCPQDMHAPLKKGRVISLPLGILIAIVVGIALVIGVLILTVGVVCLKRQQHDPRQRPETTYYVRARQDPEYHLEMVPGPPVNYKNANPGELTSKRPRPKVQKGQNLRENLYARRMESRPLPSIPNLPENPNEEESADQNVQLHRTQSGREHYHYQPRIYMRPVPQSAPIFPVNPPVVPAAPVVPAGAGHSSRPSTAASGSISAGDPQYFVLDADELKERDEREEAARARSAARTANAEAQGSTVNPQQKSPEEENAENFNKEVHLNNSCHEIPLRPTREGSQTRTTPNPNITNESNNTGNCSWP